MIQVCEDTTFLLKSSLFDKNAEMIANKFWIFAMSSVLLKCWDFVSSEEPDGVLQCGGYREDDDDLCQHAQWAAHCDNIKAPKSPDCLCACICLAPLPYALVSLSFLDSHNTTLNGSIEALLQPESTPAVYFARNRFKVDVKLHCDKYPFVLQAASVHSSFTSFPYWLPQVWCPISFPILWNYVYFI